MSQESNTEFRSNQYTPSIVEIKEMMKRGISLDLYIQRKRHGWNENDAQKTKPRRKEGYENYKQFSDFELEHLMKNYITYMDYKNRRSLGWTREEAIFIPKGIKRHKFLKHELYPVTRQEFISIYKNNSTLDTYRTRRALGWDKESAINTPK
ncbi:hypothetical protein [Staphylococcus aureus]|uniref:hypothetical protein n=1 Tax=Staphylococcus aureus TaxID=1280 RepID=UPI000DE45E81|nr:hypothetical protein [Staphylococcus aureus]